MSNNIYKIYIGLLNNDMSYEDLTDAINILTRMIDFPPKNIPEDIYFHAVHNKFEMQLSLIVYKFCYEKKFTL